MANIHRAGDEFCLFGWMIEWSDASNARIVKWDSNA